MSFNTHRNTTKHATRADAEKAADQFLKSYGWGYDPRVTITPDDPANPDGPCTLYTERADSCD